MVSSLYDYIVAKLLCNDSFIERSEMFTRLWSVVRELISILADLITVIMFIKLIH